MSEQTNDPEKLDPEKLDSQKHDIKRASQKHKLDPLKLIAKDLEDLQILAAHLQDSLLPMLSMSYDPKEKVFRALANRFCWEHGEHEDEDGSYYYRTHSGLEIHHVTKVLHKNFDFKGSRRAHNLLTLSLQDDKAIHLVFSGDSEIRVEVDDMHILLGDVHHPWPTRKKPTHLHEHVDRLASEE